MLEDIEHHHDVDASRVRRFRDVFFQRRRLHGEASSPGPLDGFGRDLDSLWLITLLSNVGQKVAGSTTHVEKVAPAPCAFKQATMSPYRIDSSQ